MHFIKKILKTSIIILIIAGIGFCGYRYYKLKEDGKLNDVFAKNESTSKDFSYDSEFISSKESNDEENFQEEDTSQNNSSEGEYVVEKKNYDDYYNKFNFDNRLVLYEGNQGKNGAKEALDILIMDADDPLYSKPTIIFENFNGLSTNEISANNLEEYKNVLNAAKLQLGENTYTFTFGYNKLKTTVNKITITKN